MDWARVRRSWRSFRKPDWNDLPRSRRNRCLKNMIDIKSKLQNNELTLGSWMMVGHPAIAEILSKSGLDWVVVDLEHTTISEAQAGEALRVIDLCGTFPMVRLTSNNPDQIKRMMDAGARGVVVPNVSSAEEARRAVQATKYGPDGTRGVGLGKAQGYGSGFDEYLSWQKNGPVVIVQIEDIAAVDRIESILAVPGVDGYFIGPYDLSCSMGIPGEFENPRFQETINKILQIGLDAGRPAGIHVVEPDLEQLRRRVSEGYRIIAYSVDTRMLDSSIRKGVKAAAGEYS